MRHPVTENRAYGTVLHVGACHCMGRIVKFVEPSLKEIISKLDPLGVFGSVFSGDDTILH